MDWKKLGDVEPQKTELLFADQGSPSDPVWSFKGVALPLKQQVCNLRDPLGLIAIAIWAGGRCLGDFLPGSKWDTC